MPFTVQLDRDAKADAAFAALAAALAVIPGLATVRPLGGAHPVPLAIYADSPPDRFVPALHPPCPCGARRAQPGLPGPLPPGCLGSACQPCTECVECGCAGEIATPLERWTPMAVRLAGIRLARFRPVHSLYHRGLIPL